MAIQYRVIRKASWFLLCLFWAGFLSAQSRQMQVLDKATLEPVAFAHIKVQAISSEKVTGYLANEKGVFSVFVKAKSVVTIQAMGYKILQDTLVPQKHNQYKFFLEQDILNLDEFVVTATRTDKHLKDAPVITQVITSKEIENKGINSIENVLQTALPGIEFQRHGTSKDVDVQGLGGRNILVLVDGERLAGETRGNIDYDRINTQDIQKVEIVKGASSALYGSQAMGAVINIITKKSKKKWYAELSTQQKTNSERNFKDIRYNDANKQLKKDLDRRNSEYNLLLGFNSKKWRSKTLLNFKNTDGYTLLNQDSVIEKRYVKHDTVVYQKNNNLPTGVEGGKQLSASQKFSYQFNKKWKAEGEIHAYLRHKYDFYKEDKKHDYFKDFGYNLKLEYDNLDRLSMLVSFASDVYKKYDYKERLQDAELNYRDRFFNPKALINYQYRRHQLLLGVEALRKTLLTDRFVYGTLVDKKSDTYTLFFQDDFKFTERLTCVIGGRGQYNTAFQFQFTPKLSLMYALKQWRFRANYAMGYRAPGLKELYMNWNHFDMFRIIGNEHLKPETNQYTSVSTEYTRNNFNMSLSVFYNAFKNKISGIWANNQTIYRYDNIENTQLYGCDWSAKIKLGHFVVSGAYSYVNERNTSEAVRLSAISPHTANMQVQYAFSRPNYRFNVNWGMRYIGEKDFFVQDELEIGGQSVNDYYPVNYKGYMISRLAVQQEFINAVSCVVGVENLFNYKAPRVTFNSYTGTGRLFFVKLTVKVEQLYNKWIK